jgi:hypothetical protein
MKGQQSLVDSGLNAIGSKANTQGGPGGPWPIPKFEKKNSTPNLRKGRATPRSPSFLPKREVSLTIPKIPTRGDQAFPNQKEVKACGSHTSVALKPRERTAR